MSTTLTVTDITASFNGRHAFGSSLSKASPFIEVQTPRGGCACTAADLERSHGKASACAPGPMKLERSGSHLVIKVVARAQEAAVQPESPSSPADIIAFARVSAHSPKGDLGVQTAMLLDGNGQAAGQVTCKVEDMAAADDEGSPGSPSASSTASNSSSMGAHIKSAMGTAADKTLKLATCMLTAPKTAFTDDEAVYRHQDTFCAAFGTFPTPMTGTSFLRV